MDEIINIHFPYAKRFANNEDASRDDLPAAWENPEWDAVTGVFPGAATPKRAGVLIKKNRLVGTSWFAMRCSLAPAC
jgi:hypothetical protein